MRPILPSASIEQSSRRHTSGVENLLKAKSPRKNENFFKKLVQELYRKILKNQIILKNYDLHPTYFIYFEPNSDSKYKRTNPVRFYFFNYFCRFFAFRYSRNGKNWRKKKKIYVY